MALVSYTGKNVFGVCLPGNGDIVRLIPGINEIEDSILKIMESHPLFQSRINKGLVQILKVKQDKEGKLSLDEMLSYIPKIFDSKLLKKIIETDGRERVIKQAQTQLEMIKNPAKKSDSDEHFA